MKIAITGIGWYGLPLLKHLAENHETIGTKTHPEEALALRKRGVNAIRLTLTPEVVCEQPDAFNQLDAAVVNIPPSGIGAEKYVDAIRNLSAFLMERGLKHLLFVSSTGVFGAHQPEVEEGTIPEPDTDNGKVLLECERLLMASFPGKVSLLRPAGLIDDRRHPGRFLAGRQGVKGKVHPVNLVHLHDLIQITEAILMQKERGIVWHAVSPEHPVKETYYSDAALEFGLELPQFDPADLSAGRWVHGEATAAKLGITYKFDSPYAMLHA